MTPPCRSLCGTSGRGVELVGGTGVLGGVSYLFFRRLQAGAASDCLAVDLRPSSQTFKLSTVTLFMSSYLRSGL